MVDVLRKVIKDALSQYKWAAVALPNMDYFLTRQPATFDRSEFCPCHATGEYLLGLLGTGATTTRGDRNTNDTLANFRLMMQYVGTQLRTAADLVVWLKLDEHSITLVKTNAANPIEMLETWAGRDSNGFDLHENLYHSYVIGQDVSYWAAHLLAAFDDNPATRAAAGAKLTVYKDGYEGFKDGVGSPAMQKVEVNMRALKAQDAVTRQLKSDALNISMGAAYKTLVTQQEQLYEYGYIADRVTRRKPPYTQDAQD